MTNSPLTPLSNSAKPCGHGRERAGGDMSRKEFDARFNEELSELRKCVMWDQDGISLLES